MGCSCSCSCIKKKNNRVAAELPFSSIPPDQTQSAARTRQNPGNPLTNIAAAPKTAPKPQEVSSPTQELVPTEHFNLHKLPLPVQVAFFTFLEPTDIPLLSCVCKDWKGLIDEWDFWLLACQHEAGAPLPEGLLAGQPTFMLQKLFWWPLTRNLLRNPMPTTLQQDAKVWRLCGDNKKISIVHVPDQETNNATEASPTPTGDEDPKLCVWRAPSNKVHRKQILNLEHMHFPFELLDKASNDDARPHCYISELYYPEAPNAKFRIRVKLLGAWVSSTKPQEVLAVYDPGEKTDLQAGEGWSEEKYCFTSYPKGVRYICFEDWGSNVAFCNPSVTFTTPSTATPPPLPPPV